MLNILTGSLLDNGQDEEPVTLRHEEHFSAESLSSDEWKIHLVLEAPTGSMLNFLHRSRCIGSDQCVNKLGKEGRSSHDS